VPEFLESIRARERCAAGDGDGEAPSKGQPATCTPKGASTPHFWGMAQEHQ
jgi:hypothetical protein